jgi:hypothetical protein
LMGAVGVGCTLGVSNWVRGSFRRREMRCVLALADSSKEVRH